MIKNIIKNNIITKQFAYYFSHGGPIPSKLKKVQDTVVYIYIKNSLGQIEKCPAFVGESLLTTITRMRVKGFQPDLCRGHDATYLPHQRPHDPFSEGPTCGMCRVVLQDNWFQRVFEQTDGWTNKQRNLVEDTFTDPKINVRLACCVPIQGWMQGMTLTIDPIPTLSGESTLF